MRVYLYVLTVSVKANHILQENNNNDEKLVLSIFYSLKHKSIYLCCVSIFVLSTSDPHQCRLSLLLDTYLKPTFVIQ